MKRLLFGLILAAMALPAFAQVNRVPQLGVVDAMGSSQVNQEGQKLTYSAGSLALATVTGATDIYVLPGSATKTVRVSKVVVSCSIATAAQYVDVNLIKRSTADTAGTSGAVTIVPHDSADAAATSAPLSYTGNPTLGTPIGVIDARRVFFPLTGTAALGNPPVVFDFGDRAGAKTIVLRGVAQQVAVNLNAPANAGTCDITAEWTEE